MLNQDGKRKGLKMREFAYINGILHERIFNLHGDDLWVKVEGLEAV